MDRIISVVSALLKFWIVIGRDVCEFAIDGCMSSMRGLEGISTDMEEQIDTLGDTMGLEFVLDDLLGGV